MPQVDLAAEVHVVGRDIESAGSADTLYPCILAGGQ